MCGNCVENALLLTRQSKRYLINFPIKHSNAPFFNTVYVGISRRSSLSIGKISTKCSRLNLCSSAATILKSGNLSLNKLILINTE